MRCPNCKLCMTYKDAPKITECTTCGEIMRPTAQDILEYGMYGITKEVRPTQVKMSQDIEKFLRGEGGTLLIEGGTGIGKSFAYLIPALITQGKRIVISTAMTSLQDQLYTKDLPLLVDKMKLGDVKYGIFKGKNHYACRKRLGKVPAADKQQMEDFERKYSGRPLDVAKWEALEEPKWWPKVSAKNCINAKICPNKDVCRPKPKDMMLVVTNHTLIGIDYRLDGLILGPYDILIVDEGHKFHKALRAAFSSDLTRYSVRSYVKDYQQDDALMGYIDDSGVVTTKDTKEDIEKVLTSFTALHTAANGGRIYKGTLDLAKIQKQVHNMRETLAITRSKIFLISESVRNSIAKASDKSIAKKDFKEFKDDKDKLRKIINVDVKYSKGELESFHITLRDLLQGFSNMREFLAGIDLQNEERPADGIEVVSEDSKGIHRQLVEIGPVIQPHLARVPHKIMLSATLALGKDFSYFEKELGLDPTLTEKGLYESPFDLNTQAVVYLPDDLPLYAPRQEPEARATWVAAHATRVNELVKLMKGDTLVLFTARDDMEDYIKYLDDHDMWRGTGITVIEQKNKAAPALRAYMATPNSVIFGLKGLWEGIDIPGKKLKMVIITKLPFPSPKDPLNAAQAKKLGGQAFNKLSKPQMFMEMRQAVGRLLRATTDVGFIVHMDPRTWTGSKDPKIHAARMVKIMNHPQNPRMGYGKELLDILGYPKITRHFTNIEIYAKAWFGLG